MGEKERVFTLCLTVLSILKLTLYRALSNRITSMKSLIVLFLVFSVSFLVLYHFNDTRFSVSYSVSFNSVQNLMFEKRFACSVPSRLSVFDTLM